MAEAFVKGDKHVFGDVEYQVEAVHQLSGPLEEQYVTVEFRRVPVIVLPRNQGAVVTDANETYYGFVRVQNTPYAESYDKPWIQFGSGNRFTTDEVKEMLAKNGGVEIVYDGEGIQQ